MTWSEGKVVKRLVQNIRALLYHRPLLLLESVVLLVVSSLICVVIPDFPSSLIGVAPIGADDHPEKLIAPWVS